MSGWMGYALGYENGRSDAERSRQQRELVQRVIYGQRAVEVDQSYLIQLQQLAEQFRSDSDHNLGKAECFEPKLLSGKLTLSATRPARQPCRRK